MTRVLAFLLVICPIVVHAGIEGPLIKLGVKELMTILTKEGEDNRDALERLGGEEGVAELLEKSFEQGGSNLVNRVVYYGERYRGDALMVISPSPKAMVAALDALDSSERGNAIRAAARDPEGMSTYVQSHGKDVLTLSIQHPGLAITMMESLDTRALTLGHKLTTPEIMVILSLLESINGLPKNSQDGFYALMDQYPSDVVIALEVRPDLLTPGVGATPVEDLRRLIEEGVPLPPYQFGPRTTLEYLVGNLSCMMLVLAGVLLVSWGLSGFQPSSLA